MGDDYYCWKVDGFLAQTIGNTSFVLAQKYSTASSLQYIPPALQYNYYIAMTTR